MVILGILLALVAAGLGAGVIVDNSSAASISIFGQQVPGVHTEGQVFAAGVLVAIVFMLGLATSVLTMGRAIRLRRELRDLREEQQESLTALQREKAQLQRELARARSAASEAAGVTGQATASGYAGTTGSAGAYRAGGERPTTGDVRVAPGHARDRDPMSSFLDSTSS